jgi:hypothetical protein
MAKKPFTLYWSSLDTYEHCPQRFLWSRGWGAIDLGNGPGKRKPKPIKRSAHHAFMGTVIQAVIEWMYNSEIWRDPQKMKARMLEQLDKTFRIEQGNFFLDSRMGMPHAEMYEVCQNGIVGFVKTMKANRLLGPYAKSEIDLVGYANKWTPIGGRADIIIRREDTGVSIFDGKNSQTKGKYTDPDQLRWYALCFYLAYGKMPERLGFIYFRYPYGTPIEGSDEVESGIDWIPYAKTDIQGLAQRAIDARKAMHKEKFDPNPSPPYCKWCDWETVCEERQAQRKKRARKPKEIDDTLDGADGFVDITF